jgi:hypothetical protein
VYGSLGVLSNIPRYAVEQNGFPYTKVPNVLFDTLLADLSGAELKVYLYILRRTVGFGKLSDVISLPQFTKGIHKKDGTVLDHGTGLHHETVLIALTGLEQKGLITRKKQGKKVTYTILLDHSDFPSDGDGITRIFRPSPLGNSDPQKKEQNNTYRYREKKVLTEEERQAYYQQFAEENAEHLAFFLKEQNGS